ncbi:hypothetical protein EDF67_103146 [Sphingobacterium sp. JUb78]|nr:hypothetical protein [Sphingobacterium kitahiroshimense]TCR11733.1 hypothetical protein EDF67_103146 [Sphingobacterium sp. JUb78]
MGFYVKEGDCEGVYKKGSIQLEHFLFYDVKSLRTIFGKDVQ